MNLETKIKNVLSFIDKKLNETYVHDHLFDGEYRKYCLSPQSRQLLQKIKNMLNRNDS